MAEFQTKRKRRTEEWASFAEDLKNLVVQAEVGPKPFPRPDCQLSFAVRQRAPATVDTAVAAVLELETYLQPVTKRSDEPDGREAAASVTRRPLKDDPMEKVIERLEKLQVQMKRQEGAQRTHRQRRDPTKITCKEEGHISRNCPNKQPVPNRSLWHPFLILALIVPLRYM